MDKNSLLRLNEKPEAKTTSSKTAKEPAAAEEIKSALPLRKINSNYLQVNTTN